MKTGLRPLVGDGISVGAQSSENCSTAGVERFLASCNLSKGESWTNWGLKLVLLAHRFANFDSLEYTIFLRLIRRWARICLGSYKEYISTSCIIICGFMNKKSFHGEHKWPTQLYPNKNIDAHIDILGLHLVSVTIILIYPKKALITMWSNLTNWAKPSSLNPTWSLLSSKCWESNSFCVWEERNNWCQTKVPP